MSLVITGRTRRAVVAAAHEMDRRARLEKNAVREGYTAPVQVPGGTWCVWLDYVLPVGVARLGLGDVVIQGGKVAGADGGDRALSG